MSENLQKCLISARFFFKFKFVNNTPGFSEIQFQKYRRRFLGGSRQFYALNDFYGELHT